MDFWVIFFNLLLKGRKLKWFCFEYFLQQKWNIIYNLGQMDYTWKRRFYPLGFHKCSKSETHSLSCFESVTFCILVALSVTFCM